MAMAPLAHARGVALALEAEEPIWMRGEPTLLNELLSNLVDNALAHTPPGGNVVLRVHSPCVLEVEDDGPGIPLHERDRVFERFYRRNQQSTGSGLGLAIVGEICRAHLARITLHDGVERGLRVRVTFVPLESGAV
jgi:two-component system sensor histidine kinase TctE